MSELLHPLIREESDLPPVVTQLKGFFQQPPDGSIASQSGPEDPASEINNILVRNGLDPELESSWLIVSGVRLTLGPRASYRGGVMALNRALCKQEELLNRAEITNQVIDACLTLPHTVPYTRTDPALLEFQARENAEAVMELADFLRATTPT